MKQLGILFLLLLTEVSTRNIEKRATKRRCWSSDNNSHIAKWWPHGSRIDRGVYWYTCEYGELKPGGCFTRSKRRIRLNESFVEKNYVMTCVLERGYVVFKYTGCASSAGRRYGTGETWRSDNGKFWFVCVRNRSYIRIDIGGCVTSDHRNIKIGEEMIAGDAVYQCQRKANGSVAMCSIGCMHQNRRYKIGDSWPEGEFTYYCEIVNGQTKKVCVGCRFRNRKLRDGDRYFKGDVVYECQVGSDNPKHAAIACVYYEGGVPIQRRIGCRWDVRNGRHKVEMTCIDEGTGNNARPRTKGVACIYQRNGKDYFYIKPGTYTLGHFDRKGAKAIGCQDDGNGRLRVIESDPEGIMRVVPKLRYAIPNGRK